jgi:antitoxin FitA
MAVALKYATCNYAVSMSKMIQIRNVSDSLHRRLRSRATVEGLSLSDFLLKEIQQIAERPTLKELFERLATRTRVKCRVSPAQILREERGI